MSILSAVILGVIQGVAEFLPISSSGHLAIAQNLLGLKIEGSTDGTFDVLLHLGTLIAVFVAYWPDIVDMIREFFLGVKDIARGTTPTPVPPNRRMILLLIIGTLPLFVIVPIKDYIEGLSANTIVVGCALLMACHSATCTYMIHIVGKVGGSESMMGSALAVAAFLELPAMGLFSRMRRKVPLVWLLIFCAVFFVIRAGLFWAARSVPVLYLAAALDFFEYGIFIPATVYYVAEHIDPANQVKGQSLMGMATTGVGSAFGNFVSGQLLDRAGVNGMLLFCSVCAAVGLLVVIYAVRRK